MAEPSSSKRLKNKNKHDRFDTSKPQFLVPKQDSSKIVLDERFSSVLSDPRFQVHVADKYGRRRKGNAQKDALSEFYTVESSLEPCKNDQRGKTETPESSSSSSSSANSTSSRDVGKGPEGEKDGTPSSRIAYLTALSRGQLDVSSSSHDEDESEGESLSSDESDDKSLDEDSTGDILDPSTKEEDIELTDDSSPYLALLNLDWEKMRAVDLFVLLSSFVPTGSLKRVRVFPSDFGKKKIAIEEIDGPKVWRGGTSETLDGPGTAQPGDEAVGDQTDSDTEDDAGVHEQTVDAGFDPEKLRAYEASKLKYYFAVAEFVTAEQADVAYREVDMMEFEHSGAAVDLRIIPKHTLEDVISGRTLRDEAVSVPSNYVPPDFVVSALQQTQVRCSWEAGDPVRAKNLTKYRSGQAWQVLAENGEFNDYVASASSEGEQSDQELAIDKRKLLGLETSSASESDDANFDMEASFIPEKKNEDEMHAKNKSPLGDGEDGEELTPWQKYLEKRKEKRRERRQVSRAQRKDVDFKPDNGGEVNVDAAKSKPELDLLFAGDDTEQESKGFNMRELVRSERNKSKQLRGARKRKEEQRVKEAGNLDFLLDLADERFKAVLDGTNEKFGIDRTDPNFKATPAMRDLLAQQLQRQKAKRSKKSTDNVTTELASSRNPGAMELSAPVPNLQSKVKK